MQASTHFMKQLRKLANADHYLFSARQLEVLLPEHSASAFRSLLTRLCQRGKLNRVCRGVYLVPEVAYPRGDVLYHTAAMLGADEFCYLSLESVLSDAGVISQIPLQHITLMTSGRRQSIDCGKWGSIEWIHTVRRPEEVVGHLHFDARIRLWRADVPLAMEDMRRTGRSQDLIQMEVLDEFI